MKKFYLFAFIGLSFASCKTSKKAVYNEYSALYLSKPTILTKPVIADMEVGSKTSVSQSYSNTLVESAKELAMAQFCKDHSCDVIVQPSFSIETETFDANSTHNTVKVKITGFPGTYKNIRNYEPKDSAYFNSKILSFARSADYVPQTGGDVTPPKKHRKTGLVITSVVLGTLGLLALLL